MEQERINKNVNELSQKLLEGCKLLSESCPETNVPLVSTADGRMYSVGNGCYYVRDGGELVKISSHALPPPSSPPKSASMYRSGATNAPLGSVSVSHHSPQRADTTEGGQSLSSRVAAKLLEGYTLLSESCPVTSVPLVQDQHGRILSVGTGKWYERTGGQLLESMSGSTIGTPAPPASFPYQPAAYTPSAPQPYKSYTPAVAPNSGFVSTNYSARPVPQASAPPPRAMPPQSPLPSGSGAVASALLAAADANAYAGFSPRAPPNALQPAAAIGGVGAPVQRIHVQQAVAVLSSRLSEATAQLSDANLRDAAGPVALIKDIALAIAALRAL
jgi:hypothetical protein